MTCNSVVFYLYREGHEEVRLNGRRVGLSGGDNYPLLLFLAAPLLMTSHFP